MRASSQPARSPKLLRILLEFGACFDPGPADTHAHIYHVCCIEAEKSMGSLGHQPLIRPGE